MEKKFTRLSLTRILAKDIRRKNKEKCLRGVRLTKFNIDTEGDITTVSYDGKSLLSNQRYNIEAFKGVIMDALSESGSHGRILSLADGYIVYTYQKPCKDFELLNYTLKRLTDFELSWDMVGTVRENGDNSYLAFNKESCKEALGFIRCHRKAKGLLHAEIIRPETKIPSESLKMLRLSVINDNGETVDEKCFC